MEELKEITVNSTKDQLKDFKDSIIWSDIVRELTAWRLGFQTEQCALVDNIASENPSTANVLTHLGSIDGRIKAVDYMLSLPDIFLDYLEEKDDSNSNRTE